MSDKQPITEHPSSSNKKISRRDFLKLTGVGVATATVLRADGLVSHEHILNSRTLVPDFFDVPKPSNQNILGKIPQNDDEARNIVSDYYKQNFGNHGDEVLDVMQKTASQIGSKMERPDTVSIVPALNIGEITKDEIGNITAIVEISESVIDKLVSQSDASIISMLEIGKFKIKAKFYTKEMTDEDVNKFNAMGFSGMKINGRVTYTTSDGKTYTQTEYEELKESFSSGKVVELDEQDRSMTHEDGYFGEYTYNNLKSLTNIARNHSDKFFVGAGGNPSTDKVYPDIPDIREARRKLEEEGLWPENLITTGFTYTFGTGETSPMTVGHDIYLSTEDMENAGIKPKTSFTMARITEISKLLVTKGANTNSRLKASLFGMCETKIMDKPFDTELDQIQVRVLS